MRNYIGPADPWTFTAPGALTGGVLTHVSGRVGVVVATVASGAQASMKTSGIFSGLAKTTGEAWAVGQKLYYVTGTGALTTTAGANIHVGWAHATAASGDTTGTAALSGQL